MDDQYLKSFLNEHFCYEVGMFYFANTSHNSNKVTSQEALYMSLESFLFHGRNLLEFFYYKAKPGTKYARAIHFIDGDKWKQNKPAKTANIIELENRINREVVHLTFDRISGTPPEKYWNFSGCFYDLLKVIKIFVNLLPERYCGEGIAYLKNSIGKMEI